MSQPARPPADQPAPGITIRLSWGKLREMRTAFQLLALIAAGALICAIVPQNSPPEEYYTRYGRFLGNVITRLSLDHVHSAWWFLLLLALLLLSLVACSGRLWREASARWRLPAAAAAAQRTTGATALTGTAPLGIDAATAKLQAASRHHGYRAVSLGQDGPRQVLYLHRHRFSAWGQALAHYSVFLIALGSVMGTIHGLSLDQNVDIEEGQTYTSRPEHIGQVLDLLPFAIHVDKFSISQDPNDGSVKNYFSDVRLLVGQQEVAKGTISVNHPLRYKGYFISQSSWGLGQALVEVTRDGKTESLAFPLARMECPGMDETATVWGVPQDNAAGFLSDGHTAVVAANFYADARREGKEVKGSPSEYPGQPALNVMLVGGLPSKDKPTGPAAGPPKHSMNDLGWLFAGESKPFAGGQIKFVGITKTTGLGIRKDVGLPLVWAGFIASMVGLALIFYFPLQRRVIALEPKGSASTALSLVAYGRTTELSEDVRSLWSHLLAGVGGTAAARNDANTEAASGKGAASD